jgi:uncharacterized membrane-anchored protein
MALHLWSRQAEVANPKSITPSKHPVSGRARCDRRTKDLVHRLRRGEIAVIDHEDLDGAAARELIARHPAAVLNAAASTTGRYPNTGPAILLEAAIPLIDSLGPELFERVTDGRIVQVQDACVLMDGREVARGVRVTPGVQAERLEAARGNLQAELRKFSENTLRYLAAEAELATADLPLPPLRTSLRGRPVVVVVRGEGCRADLAVIRGYIRDAKPVLIGVDGGAEVLRECGYHPHLILGDMDSATDATLACGAELVVHTYTDGRASPGWERVQRLGLSAHPLPAPGTSEDVAMLLAAQAGAELIVAVGTHFSLVEFLDKRRGGMASTFITRLKVGAVLVDAKGVSRLYRPGVSPAQIAVLLLSAVTPMIVIALHSAAVQRWLSVVSVAAKLWWRRLGLG